MRYYRELNGDRDRLTYEIRDRQQDGVVAEVYDSELVEIMVSALNVFVADRGLSWRQRTG